MQDCLAQLVLVEAVSKVTDRTHRENHLHIRTIRFTPLKKRQEGVTNIGDGNTALLKSHGRHFVTVGHHKFLLLMVIAIACSKRNKQNIGILQKSPALLHRLVYRRIEQRAVGVRELPMMGKTHPLFIKKSEILLRKLLLSRHQIQRQRNGQRIEQDTKWVRQRIEFSRNEVLRNVFAEARSQKQQSVVKANLKRILREGYFRSEFHHIKLKKIPRFQRFLLLAGNHHRHPLRIIFFQQRFKILII